MPIIRIQPQEREDKTLPYPFFIDEKGFVGRQDFWRGKPLKLIGFSTVPKTGEMDVTLSDFLEVPDCCIEMYPVMEWEDGTWHTYKDKIMSFEIS
jgi:hypothetical protein